MTISVKMYHMERYQPKLSGFFCSNLIGHSLNYISCCLWQGQSHNREGIVPYFWIDQNSNSPTANSSRNTPVSPLNMNSATSRSQINSSWRGCAIMWKLCCLNCKSWIKWKHNYPSTVIKIQALLNLQQVINIQERSFHLVAALLHQEEVMYRVHVIWLWINVCM